jgi:hypothetical protein
VHNVTLHLSVTAFKKFVIDDFNRLMLDYKIDTKGGKINWLQIRWLRYMKEKSDFLLFKYKFEDEFREMKVSMYPH